MKVEAYFDWDRYYVGVPWLHDGSTPTTPGCKRFKVVIDIPLDDFDVDLGEVGAEKVGDDE